MKVVIMSGIPGSGKSTWANENLGLEARIISADHYFLRGGVYQFDASKLPQAHQECFRKFLAAIQDRAHSTVVVDNTNLTAWQISPYVLAAEAHGCQVEIVRVSCDPEKAAQRNIHGVPRAAYYRLQQEFEKRDLLPWWKVTEVRN